MINAASWEQRWLMIRRRAAAGQSYMWDDFIDPLCLSLCDFSLLFIELVWITLLSCLTYDDIPLHEEQLEWTHLRNVSFLSNIGCNLTRKQLSDDYRSSSDCIVENEYSFGWNIPNSFCRVPVISLRFTLNERRCFPCSQHVLSGTYKIQSCCWIIKPYMSTALPLSLITNELRSGLELQCCSHGDQ